MDCKRGFDRIRSLASKLRLFFGCDLTLHPQRSKSPSDAPPAGPAAAHKSEHPREIRTAAGAEARSQPKKSPNLLAIGRIRSNFFFRNHLKCHRKRLRAPNERFRAVSGQEMKKYGLAFFLVSLPPDFISATQLRFPARMRPKSYYKLWQL